MVLKKCIPVVQVFLSNLAKTKKTNQDKNVDFFFFSFFPVPASLHPHLQAHVQISSTLWITVQYADSQLNWTICSVTRKKKAKKEYKKDQHTSVFKKRIFVLIKNMM